MNNVPTKCLHPVAIRNKSTDELMFVPCGHCVHCRHSYTQKWQERLNIEMEHSVSTLFITLTYDNDHLPVYLHDGFGNFHPQSKSLKPFQLSNYDYDFSNLYLPPITSSNRDFTDSFACVSKYDVQLFLKRLRRQIDYDKNQYLTHVSYDDKAFRYFICSEYGPKTNRPHLHGLLFFKSECVANAVKECYLAASWKCCASRNRDCQFVFGKASEYVSKYVTVDSSLPDILKTPFTHTFHLFSRYPTIGVYDFKPSDLQHVVSEHDITYTKVHTTADFGIESVILPLPSQLLRYWCPKTLQPASLSRDQLLSGLYKAYQFCRSNSIDSLRDSSLCLPNYIKYVKNKYELFSNKSLSPLGEAVYNTYSSVFNSLDDDEFWFGVPQNRMLLCRAMYFIRFCNIDINEYVRIYFDLYTIISSNNIKNQVDLINNLPPSTSNLDKLLLLYPSFVLNLPKSRFDLSLLSECAYEQYLSLYSLSLDSFYDDYGEKHKRFIGYNLSEFHVSSPEFQAYHTNIMDSRIRFDKTRKIKYYKYNYEQNF